MIASKKLVVALLIGLLTFAAGTRPASAAIQIYKVTFSAKAQFFPNANSSKVNGYLIYDTATPGNSHTVDVFPNKTYRIDGQLLGLIVPSAIGIGTLDRDQDGFFETAVALVGFTLNGGNVVVARSYIGTVPRNPFRMGNFNFQVAKSLKGMGAVTTGGLDHFTVADKWTLDPLSALPGVFNSNNSNDGVTAVEVFLQGKGYTKLP